MPRGEAGLQELVVRGGGEEMTAGTEVVGDRTERTEEVLRVGIVTLTGWRGWTTMR